ncbi:putative Inner membrane protein YihY, formerly thought to be RNase BN [Streptomyces misionensis JCM 4497]
MPHRAARLRRHLDRRAHHRQPGDQHPRRLPDRPVRQGRQGDHRTDPARRDKRRPPRRHLPGLPVRPVVGIPRGERLHRHHHRHVRPRRRPGHRAHPDHVLRAVHRGAADRLGGAAADGGGPGRGGPGGALVGDGGAGPVLAGRHRPVHRLPDHPVPRVRAGALALDRGRPRGPGRPGHVGPRQLPAADLPRAHHRGRHDLRLPRRVRRRHAVDRRVRLRRARRRGRQRRHRPGVAGRRHGRRPRGQRPGALGADRRVRRPRRRGPRGRPGPGRPRHALRVPRTLVPLPAARGRHGPAARAPEERAGAGQGEEGPGQGERGATAHPGQRERDWQRERGRGRQRGSALPALVT